MKDPGAQIQGAKIRVHIPDHSKEERAERIKTATEVFIQKVMYAKSIQQKERKEGA